MFNGATNFYNLNNENFHDFLMEMYRKIDLLDKDTNYIRNHLIDELRKELRKIIANGELIVDIESVVDDFLRNGLSENKVITDIKKKLAECDSELDKMGNEIRELDSDKVSYNSLNNGTVVFIDDDGYKEFITILKNICDEKGIKYSIAIPSSRVGNTGYLTLDDLQQLQSEGFEILSHGYTHGDLTSLTDNSLETHFKNFTTYFRNNGLESAADYIVYPGNLVNTKVKNIAKKYCKGGFGGNLDINPTTIETFEIKRVDCLQKTLEEMKNLIDIAKNEKRLLVIYTHAWLLTTDDKVQLLKDIIDYVKSSGVEILNVEKAIEKHGNIIEAYGDGVGYSLGKSGLLNFTNTGEYGVKYLPTATANLNSKTPLNYPVDSITIEKVMSGAEGSPYGDKCACIIITFKNPTDPFTCQISVPLGQYSIFTRYYNSKWLDWNCVSLMNYYNIPITDLSQPLTSYPKGITTQVCNYNATGNTLGKTLLVTTHRVHSDLFGYQEMKATDSTIIYRRNWNNSTLTWGNIEQH